MTDYEKKIADKIEKDMVKCFSNETKFHANQQLLGMTEVHRVVVMKEWMETPNERMDFSQFNKALVKKEQVRTVSAKTKGARRFTVQKLKKIDKRSRSTTSQIQRSRRLESCDLIQLRRE